MPNIDCNNVSEFTQTNNCAKQIEDELRLRIAIEALAGKAPISQLSREHSISRKFVYAQKDKASQILKEAFVNTTSKDSEVLFHIPVTKKWLEQVVLSLILDCHSSYGGVIEFFQNILNHDICKGTIFNIARNAATKAVDINQEQDLSAIKVGAHDEIFQRGKPVLVGCDVRSTYIYLLSLEEHRDADTWGTRLLELTDRGMQLNHTIADGGSGLRSGQKEAWPDVPCWGDVFHPLHDMSKLCSFLENRALAATKATEKLEKKMIKAKKKGEGTKYSKRLGQARKEAQMAVDLQNDISLLARWLKEDILSVTGPGLEVREELLQFVIEELKTREIKSPHRIQPIRKLLEGQGEELLCFADALEQDLLGLSYAFEVDLLWIRQILTLEAISPSTSLYWERAAELYKKMGATFYDIQEAVRELVKQTVRASSIVENVNSRLRNYFFLRKTLGQNYLGMLQFFFNHRRFPRSRCPERVGKSPRELLTGYKHPHWLELLGYTLFKGPKEASSEPVSTLTPNAQQAA